MTNRLVMAMPEACVARRRESGGATLSPSLESAWAGLRSAWRRWRARRRLNQSIAHLDDRLLADIGLGAEDRGFADRFARHRAANADNFWSIEASTW